MTNKLDGLSMNLENANMEKLKAVFPECFSEGTLDIDKLLSLCGEYIDNDFEKYKFEWKGKIESLKLAQKRSTGTLRPCKAESVNFDETKNLYIEGDNLEVLKLLQTAYYNKIKMIYIDPPYNTGSDFVYEDDFADPMARYKEITQQTTKSNAETMGRFHTNWLNMMYPRLRLAANLLREDGVIFISIDDNEAHNLKKLCDEVFGEENFVADMSVVNNLKGRNDKKYIARANERLLMYVKSMEFEEHGLSLDDSVVSEYKEIDDNGKYRLLELRKRGGPDTRKERPNMYYPFYVNPQSGKVSLEQSEFYSVEALPVKSNGDDGRWRWGKETAAKNIEYLFGKQVGNKYNIYEKDYLEDGEGARRVRPKSVLAGAAYSTDVATKEYRAIMGRVEFSNPKPVAMIKDLIEYATNPNEESIILDFFSGSATLAHAVMQLNVEDGGNRRFICVQIPELCEEDSEAYKEGYTNLCKIAEERLRRTGKKIIEENTQTELGDEEKSPLDVGFKVFKLDTSNLKTWDGTPIQDKQIDLFYERLNAMIDTVKDDRTDMDVVYEVMLKMGIPLDVEVQYMEINDKIAYIVGDFILMICLADKITAEDIEAMAQYAPAKIICAEAGFADDSALSNAHYILKDRAIELKLV
ncbi:MAG: putative methyltransferase [Firmicutes bacterium ADurb.Bin193]|nr:MAG: putative methyltransferase [Firmicutes bacterium ADurb.Bin193]